MSDMVVWDVMTCNLVENYQRFGGIFPPHYTASHSETPRSFKILVLNFAYLEFISQRMSKCIMVGLDTIYGLTETRQCSWNNLHTHTCRGNGNGHTEREKIRQHYHLDNSNNSIIGIPVVIRGSLSNVVNTTRNCAWSTTVPRTRDIWRNIESSIGLHSGRAV
jgi:hypothetical protein